MSHRGTKTSGRLRIVAGEARGRRLIVPKGRRVRPTPDRVREALFSILGDRCRDARVVDVCAGTGALGLEALSRGAAQVTFIERDRAVAAILSENIDRVGLDGALVAEEHVLVALRRFGRQDWDFDILFVDPPYEAGLYAPIAEAIIKGRLLAPGGVVVIEHPADSAFDVEGLLLTERRRYGGVSLSFYESE